MLDSSDLIDRREIQGSAVQSPSINKNVVIHQPYFLPWMGYFSKFIYADTFIVLDNVMFTKGSYLDRVQIVNTSGDISWIGLNIGQHFKERINEVSISNSKTMKRILKTIHYSYSKARYYKNTIESVSNILTTAFLNSSVLSELNVRIIEGFINLLQLRPPEIILSSQLPEINDSTERIVQFCNHIQRHNLIVGSEISVAVHDVDKIHANGIEMYFQDFYHNHPAYRQIRRKRVGFAKGLSIIDCIFNEGTERTNILLHDNKSIPIKYTRNDNYG